MSHSYPSGISREQFARILPTLESARHQVPDTRVDRHATDHQPPCHPPMPRRPPFQAQSSSPVNQCQISLVAMPVHPCPSRDPATGFGWSWWPEDGQREQQHRLPQAGIVSLTIMPCRHSSVTITATPLIASADPIHGGHAEGRSSRSIRRSWPAGPLPHRLVDSIQSRKQLLNRPFGPTRDSRAD